MTAKATEPRWMPPNEAPTRLVLVRHGSTVHSLERRFSGRNDLPLNDVGAIQAKALARRVGKLGSIHAIISSPLVRARETAAAISSVAGVPVLTNDDLIETDFGDWEGLSFAEAKQKWPTEMAAWLDSADVAPPGGESFGAVEQRVRRAVSTVLTAHPGQRVVIVSHVTPIKTALRIALGAPQSTMFRFHLDTASLSIVDYYADGGSSVRLVNDADHSSW